MLELARRFPPSIPEALLRTGEPLLAVELGERQLTAAAGGQDESALLARLDQRSVVAVPLRAGDQTLGILTLSTTQVGRRLGQDDVTLAEELARRVATAVENARLFQAERRAREAATLAAARTGRLQHLNAALSGAVTPVDVARVIVDQAALMFSAHTSALWLCDREGGNAKLASSIGMVASERDAYGEPSAEARMPLTDVLRTRLPLILESRAAVEERYPALRGNWPEVPDYAMAVVPLCMERGVAGALGLGFNQSRILSVEERAFLDAMARHCADALERARLYEELANERRLLRAVLRQMPCGVALAAPPDGRMVLANDTVYQLLDAIGSGGTVLLDEKRVVGYGDLPLQRAVRTGESVSDHEIEYVAPQGNRVALRVSASPVRDDAGTVVAGVGVYHDITEQRRAQERLRNLNATLQSSTVRSLALAEAAHALGAARLDLRASLDALARVVGEVVGDCCVVSATGAEPSLRVDAIHHRDQNALPLLRSSLAISMPWQELIAKVVSGGRSERIEQVDEEALLSQIPLAARAYVAHHGVSSLVLVPLRLDGQVIGMLAAARNRGGAPYTVDDEIFLEDIADRASLAIHNARLYQATQAAVNMRDEFLSIAGHELRTPITALQLELYMISRKAREGRDMPALVARSDRALRNLARLTILVDQLLDVSRLGAGRLALELGEIDLAALVKDLVGRSTDELAGAGCALTLEAGESVVGRWDRTRLEQIVTNLLSNAMKYGKGKPIKIILTHTESHALLVVSDEGIGISPNDRTRIFERFERAAAAHNYGGLGLGLWITRQIVEALGGHIDVQSELGHGATFTVELPLVGPNNR
jgi:signal transduction histidine kinase/PAS domain-containing protein